MEFLILHNYDPGAVYASGIRTAIEGFIRACPADIAIRVVGCSANERERPVGRWTKLRVGSREISFLPIVAGDPAGRGRFPMALRFTAALWRAMGRDFHLELDSCLVFHRLEAAWPFVSQPNRRIMFLHYSVPDQILDTAGASFWRHAPALYFWLERRILPTIDRVVSPRRDAVEWWHEHDSELRDRVRFLPCYVNDEVFRVADKEQRKAWRGEFAREHALDPGAPIALFVGRFDPQKDPTLLLQSWRELRERRPDAQLALIGEGSLEGALRQFIATHGLEARVRLLGLRGAEEIARWMNASDVMVMTSATEGMSMSMLEALRCGLPVVAPDLGESSGLITCEETGRIVSERSAASIAAAVDAVLSQPRHRELCSAAVAEFTPGRVLASLFAFAADASARA